MSTPPVNSLSRRLCRSEATVLFASLPIVLKNKVAVSLGCIPFGSNLLSGTQLAEFSSLWLKDGGFHFPACCHERLSSCSSSLAFQSQPWIGEFLSWFPWLSGPLLPPVSDSFVPPLLYKKMITFTYLLCGYGERETHTLGVWMLQSVLSFPLHHRCWGYNSEHQSWQHEPLSADQHHQPLHWLSRTCLMAFGPPR